MDQKTVSQSVKQYAEIVKQHFPVTKIILYGSYAEGRARDDSDIDVAVVVPRIEGDFLRAAAELCRLRRGIDARIAPVLCEEQHDQSGFVAEILKTGEIIYAAKGGTL